MSKRKRPATYGKVTSRWDAKVDVVMTCSEPVLKDSHGDKIAEKVDTDIKLKITVVIDEWTYSLGPDVFMRILRFTNGKLTDIREAGHGYANPPEVGSTL